MGKSKIGDKISTTHTSIHQTSHSHSKVNSKKDNQFKIDFSLTNGNNWKERSIEPQRENASSSHLTSREKGNGPFFSVYLKIETSLSAYRTNLSKINFTPLSAKHHFHS